MKRQTISLYHTNWLISGIKPTTLTLLLSSQQNQLSLLDLTSRCQNVREMQYTVHLVIMGHHTFSVILLLDLYFHSYYLAQRKSLPTY